jgi:hypothetical protein
VLFKIALCLFSFINLQVNVKVKVVCGMGFVKSLVIRIFPRFCVVLASLSPFLFFYRIIYAGSA